jgi:hypothetical protein
MSRQTRTRRALAGLLAILALATVAGATASFAAPQPKAVVMVDGSGSMRGFFNNRAGGSSIAGVTSGLVQTLRSQGYDVSVVLYRNDSNGKANDISLNPSSLAELSDTSKATGQLTFTDKALAEDIRKTGADAAWIITDNVADTGSGKNSTDHDLEAFYKRLQGPAVAGVDLFPIGLPFSGPIFDRSGNKSLGTYTGTRALEVYGILPAGHDAAATKRYDAAVSALVHKQANLFGNHLRAKPLLTPQDVHLELVQVDPSSVKKGSTILSLTGRKGADGSYQFAFPTSFSPGTPIEGVFGLRLTAAETGPIVMNGVKVKVTMPRKFEGGDYASAEWKAVSKPETVTIGGMSNDPTLVTVDVKIPGGIDFKPRVSTALSKFQSYWKLGMSGVTSETLTSQVVVSLIPPPQQAVLDKGFIKKWGITDATAYFTRIDPNAQSKIYDLGALFNNIKTTEPAAPVEEKGVANVDLDLNYPALTGALAVLGPLFGLLALIAGVGLYLGWRKSAVVSRSVNGEWVIAPPARRSASAVTPGQWDEPAGLSGDVPTGSTSRSRLTLMTKGIELSDEGVRHGWLKWVPFSGWVVAPAAGYVLASGVRQAKLGSSLGSESRVKIEPRPQAAGGVAPVSVDWSAGTAPVVASGWEPDVPAAAAPAAAKPAVADAPATNAAAPAPTDSDSTGASGSGDSGSFISW